MELEEVKEVEVGVGAETTVVVDGGTAAAAPVTATTGTDKGTEVSGVSAVIVWTGSNWAGDEGVPTPVMIERCRMVGVMVVMWV